MRTVTYETVLYRTADRLAIPRDTLLTSADWYPLRTFHGDRLREAWERFFWPELMRVEEFTHGGDAIEFTDGTDEMGTVVSVWSSDPEASTTAVEVPYVLNADGILIQSDDDPVWVRFRLPAPRIEGDTWDASETYAAGDQVYWGTDFYDVVSVTTAGETPASAAAKFSQVEIPELFGDYLTLGAAADFERSRRQMETATYYEGRAEAQLLARVSTWQGSMNQFPRTKVYRT